MLSEYSNDLYEYSNPDFGIRCHPKIIMLLIKEFRIGPVTCRWSAILALGFIK